LKQLPDANEGNIFNIAVIGQGNGEAVIRDQTLVWSNNGNPVIKPSDIDKVRGKPCAAWFVDMFVDFKFDANCCFAFISQKTQKIICETSSFCIVKAKRMMKFSIEECHKSSLANGSFGAEPSHLPTRPFYKNVNTKNYGWDEYLGEREEESSSSKSSSSEQHSDNSTKVDEIPLNGIMPPAFNANLSEAQREAFRGVSPNDNTLIDRSEEGYWRGLVFYYQLEDLKVEVKLDNKSILEINDRTFTIRSRLDASV